MIPLLIYISLVDQIKEILMNTQKFSCIVITDEKIYLKCEDALMEIEIEIQRIFFTSKNHVSLYYTIQGIFL